MFTGIVQAVGRIAAVEPRGDGLRIAVDIGVHGDGATSRSATASPSTAAA